MLIFDPSKIGSNLFRLRKSAGLTQETLAEAADISARTYADIERGSVSPRTDTLLKICAALRATPNDVLVDAPDVRAPAREEVDDLLKTCPPEKLKTAVALLYTYLTAE